MSRKPEWLVVVWWSQSHLWCVHQVCMQVLASYLFYQTPQWKSIVPLKWSIVRNDKSEHQRFLEPVVKKTRWPMWHRMGSAAATSETRKPKLACGSEIEKHQEAHRAQLCVCVCNYLFLENKSRTQVSLSGVHPSLNNCSAQYAKILKNDV